MVTSLYNPRQSNKLQELLQKENVTLEQILDENDVAVEFKEGKEPVKKFFTKEKLSQLLNFMMVDHHNLSDVKKTYKYPLVAAEILSTNNALTLEFFSEKDANENYQYFSKLFDEFLEKSDDGKIKVSEDMINYTRAGYIYKVVGALINSKPLIFAHHIYENPLI